MEMLVNNKDIAMFSARLMTFNVSGTAVTNNTSAAGSNLATPILYGCTVAPRTVSVTLSFYPKSINGTSRNRSISHRLHYATENIIKFESEIIGNQFEIFLPDGYWYSCLFSGSSVADSDASGIIDVTYTFLGIRHLTKVLEHVPGSGRVNCLSNTNTAFKLRLISEIDLESLTVCNITVNNVPADTELIIDSISGLITCGGENKFLDSDLIDFPYLNPGINLITCSAENATISVEYTPIFV
ncbi:MAG: hypothetical protein Q4D17_08230 [Planctomycetia bacterium]|nr:hypothetical protein [Planctomycetia bacterium]